MKVLLVCHAGVGVGLGHLSRILALAKILHDDGKANLELLIQGDQFECEEFCYIQPKFVGVRESFSQAILDLISVSRAEVVVFDIYPSHIDDEFLSLLQKLRLLNIKIVGIDGLAYSSFCEFVYIPSFFVDPKKLKICLCPVFFGWDSYLLTQVKRAVPWGGGHKVLVLTGGADIVSLGKTLPEMIDKHLTLGTEVHWVRGPYAQVPMLPNNPRLFWVMHDAPKNLSGIMQEMNYALTVFGVSFFELLQLGVPSVVFSPYGHKDDLELMELKKFEVAVVADDVLMATKDLKALMQDVSRASMLSERAQSKLKISGAVQLAKYIYSLGES